MEIAWLKERGLVSCFEDYLRLPVAVLEDARMLLEGEALMHERAKKSEGGKRRAKLR